MSTARDRIARLAPDRQTAIYWAAVLNAEFLLVVGYVAVLGVTVTYWPLYVVPFVWINLALWAVRRVQPTPTDGRKRLLAAGLAVAYFFVLAYFGGLVGPASAPFHYLNVSLTSLPPGWSPALQYSGPVVGLVVIPYKVVGYAALAYLVYATALDAANALVGGLVGLFSCVSCSFPIIAALLAGTVGSGGLLAVARSPAAYVLSTVVFAVTVGLLSWRPTPGRLRSLLGEGRR